MGTRPELPRPPSAAASRPRFFGRSATGSGPSHRDGGAATTGGAWGVGRGGPGREGRWRPLRPPPHLGHGKLRPASSSPVHPRFGREACWERGRQEKPDCGYASSLCWDRRRGPLWPRAGAGPHSPRDFCASCLATLQNCSRSSRHILDASTLAPLSSLGSASMLTTDRRIFSTLCTGLHRSALLS